MSRTSVGGLLAFALACGIAIWSWRSRSPVEHVRTAPSAATAPRHSSADVAEVAAAPPVDHAAPCPHPYVALVTGARWQFAMDSSHGQPMEGSIEVRDVARRGSAWSAEVAGGTAAAHAVATLGCNAERADEPWQLAVGAPQVFEGPRHPIAASYVLGQVLHSQVVWSMPDLGARLGASRTESRETTVVARRR